MATNGGDADTRRLVVAKASLWEIFAEEILKNQKNAPDGCPMGRCPTNDEFGPGGGHLWVTMSNK